MPRDVPTRFERTIWLVAAAAIGWQVLVPPIVGLAENGDFPKIVRRFDLVAPVADDGDRWFKYVFTRYIFDPASRWDSEFRSSESLLVRAALGLNWLVSKDGAFDIRIMGVTHAAIFLGALWLFLPLLWNAGPIRRVVLAAIVVLVFCDVMYVCYFNSFYMDAAGFLFLLLASVLFVRGNWIGFLLSCVLLVCAKPVYSILGVPIAVLTFRNAKPVFLARMGAAILILATLSGRFEVPPGYSEGAMFNVVFHGLLPGSAYPSRDLRELGLDDSYRRYAGMNMYSEGSPISDPEFVSRFSRRTGHARLAWFFLRHPIRAFGLLLTGVDAATVQRSYMGTFDKSAGLPPFTRSEAFACWSKLKSAIFGHRPMLYLIYSGMLLAAGCLLVSRRKRHFAEAVYALCVMTLLEMLAGAMADTVELERHMFPFNLCLDLLFVVLCAIVGQRFSANYSEREPVLR